jgi:thymidylate kinase
VGADGSGKTTVAGDLDKWLSWKLRVAHVYFGQPKESVRLKTMRKTGYALAKLDRATRGVIRPLAWMTSRVQEFQWVFLARYRLTLGRQAHDARAKGHIVLAERYPLEDLFDMPTPMDGPRLNREAQGRLERRMAEREWTAYESLPKPDYFLILAGDLETLHSRKPDTAYQEHAEKVAAVNQAAASRRSIDATLSYGSMELEARREVWNHLASRIR